MVSNNIGQNVAQGFFFVANMLSTVTIDNLVVPELVQMGNTSSAVLDCQFTATDDRFALQWLFNRADEPVYEWSPGEPPKVSGILEGRLDSTFKVSNVSIEEGRALRIVRLDPELSGEYTCRVLSDGGEARQTKAMLVFSPEREFVLEVHKREHDSLDIKCSAHGLYPQPDLTLEYNHSPLPKQQQRVWREGGLFAAVATARLRARPGRVACRLTLPLAGYTALRTHLIHSKHHNAHENLALEKTSGVHNSPGSAPDCRNIHMFAFVLSLVVILKDYVTPSHFPVY